jgi:membrane protease YdiL (CAAX protease family)
MSPVRSAAVAILFTYAAARTFWWLSNQSWRLLDDVWFEGLLKTLVWVGPAVLVLILIRRLTLHEAWRELGLDGSAIRGFGFGLLATVPMVLVLPFGQLYGIDPAVFAGTVVLGPFAEEVLFRGFLFRQLLTYARWPLGWAIGVSAVAFALAHHRDVDQELAGRLVRMSFGLQPHGLEDLFIRIGATIAWFAPGGALFAWIVYRSTVCGQRSGCTRP